MTLFASASSLSYTPPFALPFNNKIGYTDFLRDTSRTHHINMYLFKQQLPVYVFLLLLNVANSW